MKRSLVLAVSVLALVAVSKPLFAAEAETPAPRERAAPAAAQRQARPVQRAAPSQQAAQSSTSSFTGAQAGGFGGGNAGGGGFADPVCLNSLGGLNNGCTAASFNHSLSNTGGIGGGVVQWTTAVTPWIVVGILGDLAGGKTTSSSSQGFLYPSDPTIPGQVTAENYTSSVSQSTTGSIRFKAGVVTPFPWLNTSVMPYVTVGWVRSRFEGSFSYNAINFNSLAAGAPTIAGTSVSWSHQADGVIYGVGVDIPIPAIWPGVVLVFDYSRADFQSFDVTVPVGTATSCVAGPTRVCTTTDTLHLSNPSSNRFTAGLRVKFL
jgi:hypothetical protein